MDEKAALDEKLEKLAAFMKSDAFGQLDFVEQDLMHDQADCMIELRYVLKQRIALFKEQSGGL
ncbi:hypothetical protein AzCIB_1652 [Azoarcus sp. CIB]|nr:hypothetical protein AzCIB_1652 [Azoarcus sp. CIB]